jgi:hypothetical protein
MDVDKLKDLVPYYLTNDRKHGFLEDLKSFMNRDWLEYFSSAIGDTWLQGDCSARGPKVDVVTMRKAEIKCLVVSNSCDIDPNNKRALPARVLLAPLIPLIAYENLLLKNHSGGRQAVETIIQKIREQKITNVFYLPHHDALGGETVVLLDDLQTVPASILPDPTSAENRYFSLSQIGFFLYIFKLSVHFCRFHEEVDRPVSSKSMS